MWHRALWPVVAGVALVLVLTGEAQPPPGPKGAFPITGKAGPSLEPLDEAVMIMMERHGVPGASLAIAKDGRLVYAKGFGWANVDEKIPMEAKTLLGVASLSKPITALAILKLIEEGKLKLDDPAFAILAHIRPPEWARVDPRLRFITIRQLLNHSGGWKRSASGDPANWSPMIARKLGVPEPITGEQFISFLQTMRLDFNPGTETQYSNVGYVILGQIIEKVSGQGYEEYVRKNVFEPIGITRARIHKMEAKYFPGEGGRYLAGTTIQLPPMQLPMIRAAGGWSASAIDMVTLLAALDGSRGKILKDETFRLMTAPPPEPIPRRSSGAYVGLGFESVLPLEKGFAYSQDGSFHGMRAFMERGKRGANWVLIFNASMTPDNVDLSVAKDHVVEVRARVANLENYPKIDLFKEFR
jgi:N-acyl-D-amino-acid deacylase